MKLILKKHISSVLCGLLFAAMTFTLAGCEDKASNEANTDSKVQTLYESGATIGEGDTSFSLEVTDIDKKTSSFTVLTDAKTVGDALLDCNMIAGDDGEYGLYIKSVNGITADYDVDKTYWAFYINGEYAMTGVDTTDIEAGAVYSLKVEK